MICTNVKLDEVGVCTLLGSQSHAGLLWSLCREAMAMLALDVVHWRLGRAGLVRLAPYLVQDNCRLEPAQGSCTGTVLVTVITKLTCRGYTAAARCAAAATTASRPRPGPR